MSRITSLCILNSASLLNTSVIPHSSPPKGMRK